MSGTTLRLGTRGETLIKGYETLRLTAYKPTPNDVWTCGWGHTRDVTADTTCTREQAQVWFDADVASAVSAVNGLGVPLTQSMFDALASLVFNAGPGCVLPTSTIGSALRRLDYYTAWGGFTLWRKQTGRDLLGLARRRSREMTLFLEDGVPR